jgi:hypothetical protein
MVEVEIAIMATICGVCGKLVFEAGKGPYCGLEGYEKMKVDGTLEEFQRQFRTKEGIPIPIWCRIRVKK